MKAMNASECLNMIDKRYSKGSADDIDRRIQQPLLYEQSELLKTTTVLASKGLYTRPNS